MSILRVLRALRGFKKNWLKPRINTDIHGCTKRISVFIRVYPWFPRFKSPPQGAKSIQMELS
jgi:hypothetical protein